MNWSKYNHQFIKDDKYFYITLCQIASLSCLKIITKSAEKWNKLVLLRDSQLNLAIC